MKFKCLYQLLTALLLTIYASTQMSKVIMDLLSDHHSSCCELIDSTEENHENSEEDAPVNEGEVSCYINMNFTIISTDFFILSEYINSYSFIYTYDIFTPPKA